jgi:MOSC domain-containing protein YiiM
MMTKSGRPPYPHVHQINISDGGVPKRPVLHATVTKLGIDGDRQHNAKLHGGPGRAVCLYSLELIERLQDEGHSIDAGSSGENLTLTGVEWKELEPGMQLSLGPQVRLEIASYCAPCDAQGRWFRDGKISHISQKANPGWSRLYARVLSGGVVRPGDEVRIVPGLGRG